MYRPSPSLLNGTGVASSSMVVVLARKGARHRLTGPYHGCFRRHKGVVDERIARHSFLHVHTASVYPQWPPITELTDVPICTRTGTPEDKETTRSESSSLAQLPREYCRHRCGRRSSQDNLTGRWRCWSTEILGFIARAGQPLPLVALLIPVGGCLLAIWEGSAPLRRTPPAGEAPDTGVEPRIEVQPLAIEDI